MMRLRTTILLFALLAWMLPAAEIPAFTARTIDRAGVIDAAGRERIDGAIRQLEEASGGQMAVLVIPTLDNEPIEEFGIRVAEKWKVGHKDKDDGAILIVALNDRQMRLEVGYGWEGDINDARAGDVIRALAPFFREGRYADGIVTAIGTVQKFVTGKAPEGMPPPPEESKEPEEHPFTVVVVILIILLVLFSRGRGIFFLGGGGGFGGGGFGGGRGGGFGGGGGGSFGGGGASGRW